MQVFLTQRQSGRPGQWSEYTEKLAPQLENILSAKALTIAQGRRARWPATQAQALITTTTWANGRCHQDVLCAPSFYSARVQPRLGMIDVALNAA